MELEELFGVIVLAPRTLQINKHCFVTEITFFDIPVYKSLRHHQL